MDTINSLSSPTNYKYLKNKYWKRFDPLSFYVPDDMHSILVMSQYYYLTNHIISSIIYKMSEYPVTEIQFNTDNDKVKEKYKEIFNEIGVKEKLIEYGLNYNTYGNVFTTILPPFKNIFINKDDQNDILDLKYHYENTHKKREVPNWEIKGEELLIYSEKHKKKVPVQIKQQTINDASGFKMIFWNPLNIRINYNSFTDEKVYYYKIEKEEKKKIKEEIDFLKHTPTWMLDAIIKNYDELKLNSKNLLHTKYPSITSRYGGWGLPPIQPVMNQIFYLNMLRRAQTAIAEDHVLTKRYVAPPSDMVMGIQGPAGITGSMNLNNWKNKIQQALSNWEKNPNAIHTFPMPIHEGKIGGDAKALMVFQEIDSTINEIIAGMGVPREFLFGGLSWSGSSVSLRMLENHFLNYRSSLDKIFYFLTDKISKLTDLPKIKIKLRDFKMADDTIRKDLLINLSQLDKISDKTLLEEFDFDYNYEAKQMVSEAEDQAKVQIQTQYYQQLQQVIGQVQSQKMMQTGGDAPAIENQELGEIANYVMKGQFDKIPDDILMQITNQYTAVAMQRAMLQDPVLSQLMGLTQPGQQQPQQSNASGEVNKRKMNEQKPPQGKASQM
jgi:hypothetical protein